MSELDNLSVFEKTSGTGVTSEVTLTSTEGNDLDTLVNALNSLIREVMLLRKGMEAFDWDKEVEDDETIDLTELPVKDEEDKDNLEDG